MLVIALYNAVQFNMSWNRAVRIGLLHILVQSAFTRRYLIVFIGCKVFLEYAFIIRKDFRTAAVISLKLPDSV